MKKIEIYSFLSVASALFASYGFASEPVIIEGGTYSDAMYAVEGNTSGGSSLIINEGTFNLSSSVSKPDLYLYGGGTSGSIIEGDTFIQQRLGKSGKLVSQSLRRLFVVFHNRRKFVR